jgi:hypothetical protein
MRAAPPTAEGAPAAVGVAVTAPVPAPATAPPLNAPDFNFWGLDRYIKSIVFGGASVSGHLPLMVGDTPYSHVTHTPCAGLDGIVTVFA